MQLSLPIVILQCIIINFATPLYKEYRISEILEFIIRYTFKELKNGILLYYPLALRHCSEKKLLFWLKIKMYTVIGS